MNLLERIAFQSVLQIFYSFVIMSTSEEQSVWILMLRFICCVDRWDVCKWVFSTVNVWLIAADRAVLCFTFFYWQKNKDNELWQFSYKFLWNNDQSSSWQCVWRLVDWEWCLNRWCSSVVYKLVQSQSLDHSFTQDPSSIPEMCTDIPLDEKD